MPHGWPSTAIEWADLIEVTDSLEPVPESWFNLAGPDPDTGGRIYTLPGITGFDAPPVEIFYDERLSLDGAHLRGARNTSREIFIPVMVEGPDRGIFLRFRRKLLSYLNPGRGLGRIRLTEGDATSRYLDCVFTGGAEGDYGTGQSGFLWQKYGLTFRAIDPFWYSTGTVDIQFSSTATGLKPFFGTPFFGLNINSTHSLNGAVTLTVAGDVETWPTWKFTGPLDGITLALSGYTTAAYRLDVSLASGQTLYIDTRPGRRRILLLDDFNAATGINYWDRLHAGDSFWPVSPVGTSAVTLTVGDVGPETTAYLSYRPRFYSA
ncbi:hypothetical protein [Acrocarpospora sp. B8E8]|uniref:hypothetical protein n=1 Tax=Acrocarpospora sp. B8E8 TaxID=3153572 RepID=UPI00325C5533